MRREQTAAEPEFDASWPRQDSLEKVTPVSPYLKWKRPVERLLALLLLLPTLPVIILLVILVRLTSRGPGIFAQQRVGRQGTTFTMYKIRTMVHNAERTTGPAWSCGNDPRVTWLGRWLRKLHLDELPQLFNVLRGEMSLVGPRPERPEFVKKLSVALPNYRQRLLAPPGITGLAQINLPPDSDLASVRRKLALDLAYVQKASPWLDARMMGCTLLRVIGVSGDSAAKLFNLHQFLRLLPSEQGPPYDVVVPRSVVLVDEAVPASQNGQAAVPVLHLPKWTAPFEDHGSLALGKE